MREGLSSRRRVGILWVTVGLRDLEVDEVEEAMTRGEACGPRGKKHLQAHLQRHRQQSVSEEMTEQAIVVLTPRGRPMRLSTHDEKQVSQHLQQQGE
jgi:hypothetical protein